MEILHLRPVKWKKNKKQTALHILYKASFTLMGDNEEVLIVDLIPLYFTLQQLGWDYFVKLRVGKERNLSTHLNTNANPTNLVFKTPGTESDAWVMIGGVFYLQIVSIDDSSSAGLVNPWLSGVLIVLWSWRLVFE